MSQVVICVLFLIISVNTTSDHLSLYWLLVALHVLLRSIGLTLLFIGHLHFNNFRLNAVVSWCRFSLLLRLLRHFQTRLRVILSTRTLRISFGFFSRFSLLFLGWWASRLFLFLRLWLFFLLWDWFRSLACSIHCLEHRIPTAKVLCWFSSTSGWCRGFSSGSLRCCLFLPRSLLLAFSLFWFISLFVLRLSRLILNLLRLLFLLLLLRFLRFFCLRFYSFRLLFDFWFR